MYQNKLHNISETELHSQQSYNFIYRTANLAFDLMLTSVYVFNLHPS
jgi:hypothetical protein